jgi:tRNA G10  N-methylase Trm11
MYLFLFGRDSDLSKLELISYLYSQNIDYKIFKETNKFLILDFKKDYSNFITENKSKELNLYKILDHLASITRLVDIYYNSNKIDSKFLDRLDIDYPKKFNYSLSTININKEQKEDLEVFIKDYFKVIKSKCVYKRAIKHKKKETNFIVNPKNYYSWKLYNGFELFILKIDNNYYFGKTISCFNPKLNIYKDKHRPFTKKLYTTSFRLADIMINLLNIRKGETIVDPFCGSGTFLIELLYKGYNCIGIEKSKDMFNICKKNLEWAKKEFDLKNTYKLKNTTSQSASFKAKGAVFEPYMGPFLNNRPNIVKGKKIINDLNSLYLKVFNNLNRNLKPDSKVVCILPTIKTKDHKILKLRRDLFTKTGFRLVDVNKYNKEIVLKNPISYMPPDGSKILRDIYILEKK